MATSSAAPLRTPTSLTRERARARLLMHLADFGNFAVSSYEEDHLRKAATVAAAAMFPRGSGYITALEPGSGALKVADIFGASTRRDRLTPLLGQVECDTAAACRAISRGGAYEGVGDGGLFDCPHRGTREAAEAFICAPINSSDGPLGAIHVTRSTGADFEAEEKEIVEALGIQLGLAIANGNLLAMTRDQALRDSMTGLHNYRFLIEYLNNQAALIQRTNGRMSVLMIDIDHFRDFNNKFGHAAGDHVLRAVARIFRKCIRRSDLAARYGGEEFTVVLPGTGLEGARHVAEGIRRDVERDQLEFDGRDLGEINVSVGVVAMPDHAAAIESLL
ncbi:MAG: GGDEF domain-containing protein [Chloroflexota bacterium]|nr:GGDEF domain-containing protein [Chloroflexota bacterium]